MVKMDIMVIWEGQILEEDGGGGPDDYDHPFENNFIQSSSFLLPIA